MYTLEEFDSTKNKVLKYILYKKRTEYEIRIKFNNSMEEEILDEVIDYFKEAGYINDTEYIDKTVKELIKLKTLSIKEIKYKLEAKGLKRQDVEAYINENQELLNEYEKSSAQKLILKKQNSMNETELKSYLIKKGYKGESIQ